MPWTASTAHAHKKGMTSAEARKWARIANRVLFSCRAKGHSNCDATAIKIANAEIDKDRSRKK